MTRARILVVDDKENMLKLFAKILGDDCELTTAAEGGRALSLVEAQDFDVVVTDLKMPGADGLEVLKAVKRRQPDTEVVMMTAYATVNDAVEAMKQGAYDYLQKPFDPDAAVLTVTRALERKRLKEQAANLRKELQSLHSFHNIVGKSRAMQDVYRLLEQAAGLDITVLITGETGTGKELAARAIHYQSARRDRRFVPINCGALPAELVESELFGHARGAFTGAVGAKQGLFEEAAGGTIFLDEVGELPLAVQVKLNRALQEREIRRVGDNTPTKVDVRVIAATHRDLKAEIQTGRFREDLFYRLHVFPVRMPSLNERREDIPLLAAHFLDKHARSFKRALKGLTSEALRVLSGYRWPGNVRELENAIERAVAVAAGPEMDAGDLPAELRESQTSSVPMEALVKLPYKDALEMARDRFSRDYLFALMREFEGNVTRAAERASVERESLHRLLKRFGVRSDDFKPRDQ
ncbi:MAG: sigma-54-dependent Fis family transcriptional regulator [Phycisphaerae bacterium]|jgi:DNA-binding NtrC family response regulator